MNYNYTPIILNTKYYICFFVKACDVKIYQAYFQALEIEPRIWGCDTSAEIKVWLEKSQYEKFLEWYNNNGVKYYATT
jgi:hypothetical protein